MGKQTNRQFSKNLNSPLSTLVLYLYEFYWGKGLVNINTNTQTHRHRHTHTKKGNIIRNHLVFKTQFLLVTCQNHRFTDQWSN